MTGAQRRVANAAEGMGFRQDKWTNRFIKLFLIYEINLCPEKLFRSTVPYRYGRPLPPEVGLEDKAFHRDKEELGERHYVPTSWKLPAGMEKTEKRKSNVMENRLSNEKGLKALNPSVSINQGRLHCCQKPQNSVWS